MAEPAKTIQEPLIEPIEPFDQDDVEDAVWADLRRLLRVSNPDVFSEGHCTNQG